MGGYKLEILVLELEAEGMVMGQQLDRFLDSVLVPTMEIPTSNTGRYTPITTPVHRSLLVGQGIRGASEFLSMSSLSTLQEEPFQSWNIVQPAVDFHGGNPDEQGQLPIQFIDISQASSALGLFRKSVNNALDYERDWFASGVPALVEWLKIGKEAPDGVLRRPIHYLIESLLHNTEHSIRLESRRQRDAQLSGKISSAEVHRLRKGLAEWAEGAHTELRDQLDIAFHGRRWRKLGWWKLFWRVDDVSMIASDILNQRFLTEAEKEFIFLAGRIQEAGIFSVSTDHSENWAYKPVQLEKKEHKLGVEPPRPKVSDLIVREDTQEGKMKNQPWPLNIPLTRSYLATDTVPALQALAQKLVLQTLVTSSSFSAFAALTYISTLSTGLYEAGAVAAVGIVWSLRRMQGKWETARKFWEGEVREEGRKAVRGIEGIVGGALKVPDDIVPADPELERAEAVLSEVTEKLKACDKDDGWAPIWEENAKAFYFYNRFTHATQWTNPRVPDTSTSTTLPPPPGLSPAPAPETSQSPPPPAEPVITGYNPAIHGDYDPSAWYAQPSAPPPSALQDPNSTDPYAATAAFNRFTGRFQAPELSTENFNDENKSKRQMNAFFDVDAAANSHDGRSLKAERSGKKLSKTELKTFKEKRKAKKEEKRRAWLRD
ncbi:WW domain-containing protein [Lachnellula willkommii]|uniref:WW domain-containing protein n=1 Tax=Lachnellula willkommii TaxID=215461 RepID=A0A559MMU4_9HELO|nr:WW domain-containing protein [Lachnellula willkommii]